MGSSEDGKSSKSDKSSPPAAEQSNVHVYPDWAAMQAYYGPRVALTPYFNPTVASGHPPPPYLWGPPQPMMPPYGAPYAAIYAPGGVYAHPGVPVGTQGHCQGVSSPPTGTPLSIDTPAKSLANNDKGLMKKLKGFDGLAMSIGNGNVEKAEGGAENRPSQSSSETDGSSDGSDGNTEEADQNKRKRSREGTPTNGQMVGTAVTAGMAATLELRNPGVHVKGSSSSVSPPNAVISSETWLQIQTERELKRERRKQSNRESARRSRLRKQAETEELARRVEALTAENAALKSEINQLVENSQKLRHENATLTEKVKSLQSGQGGGNSLTDLGVKRNPTDSTENFLSRVNNSGSVSRNSEEATETYEKSSKSGAKLHQLLDTNRRADAVAAG